MKIIEIINSLSYRGGAQVLFYNLCVELSKISNEEIHVIILYDSIDSSFVDLKKYKNIIFHTIHKKNSLDVFSAFRLRKLINSINPDVINYHLPFLITYAFAFGFAKKKWSLIKTFHSIPRRDTNRFELHLEKKFVRKGLLSFVGISNSISKESLKCYPYAKIVTINNCVAPWKGNIIEAKQFDFIIVASFSKVKNHLFLFEVFKKYLVLFPNSKLLCVGNGELLETCKLFVAKNKMDDNVFFAGQQENVYEFLSKSRCFILSSLREGNPISILEAMQTGLPLVVPEIGGIPDIVKNNINGFLYKCNNEDSLLKAMVSINDEKIINLMSNNNKNKANEFLSDKMAEKYLDYYKSFK